jgi:DNA-binding XRE family transcriptional regulator
MVIYAQSKNGIWHIMVKGKYLCSKKEVPGNAITVSGGPRRGEQKCQLCSKIKNGNLQDKAGTIKNNIHDILRKRNMTQSKLAGMVGVKREYLNRIINRKITPSVSLGMRIAKALRMTVEDVFVLTA